MSDAVPEPSDFAVRDLIEHLRTERRSGGSFTAEAPDWFGDRVFGGMVVAQAAHAACQTVEPDWRPHSLHAYFLGAVRPGGVEIDVNPIRDGRTFVTREVTLRQDGRTKLTTTVSFHQDEEGDEYQLPMSSGIPAPEALPIAEDAPPPFEVRWLGPTPQRDDGTYESTRRSWERTTEPLPDEWALHLAVAAFLSDMTGTSFRPYSLGEWGGHTDASIDHAVWFHRPFRCDEWLYADFHALVNAGGRSTVRGSFYDRGGRLCMSMAQELLIRPL
jgi:acyl-CoA thioesterase II